MHITKTSFIMGNMKVNGQKIRDIRQALGMSTSLLAEKAGVTRQAVEAWERGGVGSFRMLERIANILQVPEKLLLDDTAGQ